MLPVELDRLKQFVSEYEEVTKVSTFKTQLSLTEKTIISTIIIDFCCICEQDHGKRKNPAAWHNKKIDKFVHKNEKFYKQTKTIRDSFVAHIDHNGAKEEQILNVFKPFDLEYSKTMKEFYALCKELLMENQTTALDQQFGAE